MQASTSKLIEEMKSLSPAAREWLLESVKHEQPATEAQQAFWKMMTVQRVTNLAASADFFAEISPEAREWLRKADEEKIAKLNSTIEFMTASKIIWKFLWVGGGMIVAAFAGFSVIWKTFGEFFTVKFK